MAYLFSLKYYTDTPVGSSAHDDESHTFNLALTHTFNERFSGRVSDSFDIGQEPDLLRAGNTFSTFQRFSGNNIRNYGTISVDAQMTPKFGFSVGYDNTLYDYQASGATITPVGVVASPAGTLNRIENGVHVEGLVTVQPETKALFGYRFTGINYTGDELIGGNVNPVTLAVSNPIMSDTRNSYTHTLYVGGIHNFRPDLTGSLRVGASYTDYYNDPSSSASYTPYVDLSVKWTYAEDSYVEGGFTYNRNASDQINFGVTNNRFTLDEQSGTVFASVTHRLTPKIYGSLTGQYQNSIFNGGGTIDGEAENYYLFGLNLEYRFNPHISAHIGYNYDNLQSQIGRSFDRNRVYFGFTASY
jgi:hypothetical protein